MAQAKRQDLGSRGGKGKTRGKGLQVIGYRFMYKGFLRQHWKFMTIIVSK